MGPWSWSEGGEGDEHVSDGPGEGPKTHLQAFVSSFGKWERLVGVTLRPPSQCQAGPHGLE